MKKDYRMFDTTKREIFIYDDIGPDYLGMFGTQTLREGLMEFGPGEVKIRVNSYGGSVDEALAMLEVLSRHDGDVTVSVDSIAASAASLFPAFFPSSAAKHARIMIHNPWGIAMGDANEFRKQADILDTYRESLVTIYEDAMGLDKDEIYSLLDDETWYSAAEAVEAGLVDSIGTFETVQAKPLPQNRFKNAPNDLPSSSYDQKPKNNPESSKELSDKLSALRLKCKLHKYL